MNSPDKIIDKENLSNKSNHKISDEISQKSNATDKFLEEVDINLDRNYSATKNSDNLSVHSLPKSCGRKLN